MSVCLVAYFLVAYSTIVAIIFFSLIFLDTGSVLTVEVSDTLPREATFMLLAAFWPVTLIATIIEYLKK